jgi:hypothetical protein
MTDVFCPRQIIFELPGTPGVLVTATETGTGAIDFIVDVENTPGTTADLRALFFHYDESKLGGLTVTGGDGLLTEWRVQANSVLDLGDGATLAGFVKSGFDVGLEWGTPGGKKDDIFFPVHFTLSNSAGNLNLDDFATLQFGAKLDSVGGPGGPRAGAAKLLATAPYAPDAQDDNETNLGPVYEDGASGLDSPSKTPQGVVLDVLGNDIDKDGQALTVTAFHDGPSHGTVSILESGNILYTPDLDYSGPESFEYCVSDGHGGQDHARVTFNVQAVADEPLMTYSVAQGAAINQMIVTVKATQNDADGSEYIDRIDVGSLPAGVSLSPMNVNPADQPASIEQQYMLTVPEGQDVDFDLTFTATSVEKSNGDTEDASVAVPIEIDFTHNESPFSFHTDDQSIWGTGSGKPFDFNELIGLDNEPFSFETLFFPEAPLPVPFLDVEIAGHVTFGFQTVIHLDAGNIDANLFVTATLNSSYNKTTDTLAFDTSYVLTGGNFVATGPNGNVDVTFKFDVDGNVNIALEPLDFLTGWANIDFGLPDPNIETHILDIDTDGLEVTWPIPVPGADVTLSFPQIGMNSGDLSDEDSDHILVLNVDLDAAAAELFPPAIVLSDPIPGTDIDPQLIDLDIQGFIDLFQKLTVNLDNLLGKLTLEDGSPAIDFKFGDDLPFVTNASSHDQDGDGQVEFDVAIDTDASLTSDAGLDFGVGASLYLLKDLPFGLDPIKVFDEALPLADFSFFNETFALQGFNQESWSLAA